APGIEEGQAADALGVRVVPGSRLNSRKNKRRLPERQEHKEREQFDCYNNCVHASCNHRNDVHEHYECQVSGIPESFLSGGWQPLPHYCEIGPRLRCPHPAPRKLVEQALAVNESTNKVQGTAKLGYRCCNSSTFEPQLGKPE